MSDADIISKVLDVLRECGMPEGKRADAVNAILPVIDAIRDNAQADLLALIIAGDISDTEAIGRRAVQIAMAADCSTVKQIPVSEMAKKLSVSRQSLYAAVDKFAQKFAEIKATWHRLVDSSLRNK